MGWRRSITKITAADVQRVMKQYLGGYQPDGGDLLVPTASSGSARPTGGAEMMLRRFLSMAGNAGVAGASRRGAVAACTGEELCVYQLPEAKQVKLANGLTVLLLEKHELPLVSAELMLRSGSVTDPAGKEGLESVTADLLRKGTASRSAEQFSNEMDFIGMVYGRADDAGLDERVSRLSEEGHGYGAGTAGGCSVLHPSFPEDEVKKLVAQRQDSLRAAKDNPQAVLGPYFMKALYGAHPYGRPATGR